LAAGISRKVPQIEEENLHLESQSLFSSFALHRHYNPSSQSVQRRYLLPSERRCRYGSLSLFVKTVTSLHLCVCFSRRSGWLPIRNGCWNLHSRCRNIDITLLLVGEGVASTPGVMLSFVPDLA